MPELILPCSHPLSQQLSRFALIHDFFRFVSFVALHASMTVEIAMPANDVSHRTLPENAILILPKAIKKLTIPQG